MIFQVEWKDGKKKGQVVDVYVAMEDKDKFVKFLIYDTHGWKWMSAKHFKPVSARKRNLNG